MKFLLLTLSCVLTACSIAFSQVPPDTTKPDTTTPAAAPAATPAPLQSVPQTDTMAMPMLEDEPAGIWNIVALGGWTMPFEPDQFKNEFKPNYNFGGGVAWLFPPGEAGYGEVALMLHYYNVDFNEADFRTFYNIPATRQVYGYQGDIYTGFVQFRGVYGQPNAGIAPYFTAGFGAYHIALPELGVEGPSTPITPEYEKTTVGWSVGLGLDVAAGSNLTVFIDGKFVLGVTETNGHKLFTGGAGLRYRL